MQFVYDPRLDRLLSSIEATLIAEIPPAVRRLDVSKPTYALFLWYDDSSSTDFTPRFGVGTESVLNACALKYDSDPDARFDCIWCPQQVLENQELLPQGKIDYPGLSEQCNRAYSLMLAANDSDLPLANESRILMPFRSMLRRVAASLSKQDWTGIIPTDDRFVVVALDSIGYWLFDDLRACIPPAKRDLLTQIGLLIDSQIGR